MPKKPVTVIYERDIVSTTEGSTISAMLNDLSLLLAEGPEGEIMRRVYGTDLEGDVSELRRKARVYDSQLLGQGILLTDSSATSGVSKVDDRLTNPEAVAIALNGSGSRTLTGDKWTGDDFLRETITSDAKMAFLNFYGYPIQFVTAKDLGQIERIAELAANIGVGLKGIDFASLPQVDTPGANAQTRFRIITTYAAQLKETLKAFEGASGDWLRFRGQRPGGKNFEATRQEDSLKRGVAISVASAMQAALPAIRSGRTTLTDIQRIESRLAGITPNEIAYAPNYAQKREDNFAVLRVIKGGGPRSRDPYGSTSGFEVLFQSNRFLLDSIGEATVERAAFVDTFGPTYLYLFGTKARIWSYSGVVMDTEGMTWLNEWRQSYDRYTGGTQTAKLKARAFLTYDNVVREGIMIATSIQKSVGTFGYARISFQFFVLREHYLDGNVLSEHVVDLPTFLTVKKKVQAAEDQYDVTFEDQTAESPTFTNPETGFAQEAFNVEKRLFEANQAAIEEQIKDEAFPNGRLAQTSGIIITGLSNEEVSAAAQGFVIGTERARFERFNPPTISFADAGTSRQRLASSGSVAV
jgi:hypothetical protein